MKKAFTFSIVMLLLTTWSQAQKPDRGSVIQLPDCKSCFSCYHNDSIMTFAEAYAFRFVDQSLGDVIKWHWDFGDGSMSEQKNPLHIFSKDLDSVIVCLDITTSDSCQSGFCTYLVIRDPGYPPPPNCQAYWAAYPYHPNDSLGIKFSDLPVMALGYHYSFLDLSKGNIVQWNWDFGDGVTSSDPNPRHAYQKSGRYTVCLEITTSGNCVSTWCDSLAVGIMPPCSLTGTVVDYTGLDGCGLMIRLDNGEVLEPAEMVPDFVLKPGQRVALSYTDLFDHGSICMAGRIVRIDCITEIPGLCENYIRITTDMILNGQSCNGSATATLVDKLGNSVWAKDYLWSTGDVTSTVNHLCPGYTYSVTVTDSGGCVVTGSFYFSGGNEYPDSLFGQWNYQQNNMDFIFNLPVFSDSINCVWDFGDGNAATGYFVNHTYESYLDRTVLLNVYDHSGNLIYNQEIVVSPGKSITIHESPPASPEIYPIPAKDEVFIRMNENQGVVDRIEVLSAGGQLLLSSRGEKQGDRLYRLNIASLPAGFYIGQLSYNNGLMHSFRFVK